MNSVDDISKGFLEAPPSPTRYEHKSLDSDDVAMKICQLLSKGAKVLDVGCGTGVITQTIKIIAGVDIIGIEPDAHRVTKAREKGLTIFQGFLSKEFLEEAGPFDYIIFADVLEHLPNPYDLVMLALGGLKQGGSIIASIPNAVHWFVRIDILLGRFNYQDCGIMDATHLRWFTKATTKAFFQKAKLQISSFEYTANVSLPDYHNRFPWRLMSKKIKKVLVKRLVKLFPTLFGCQFIVEAKLLS